MCCVQKKRLKLCRSPDVNFKVPYSFSDTEFRPVYDTVVSIISKLFPKRKRSRGVDDGRTASAPAHMRRERKRAIIVKADNG